MDGRHCAIESTRDGEAESLKEVLWPVPNTVRKSRIRDIGLVHILHATVKTNSMPALIQNERDVHSDERERAQGVGETESPSQSRM